MFGAFRGSAARLGGYLWKIPYKMSAPQRRRQRHRLRAVDDVIKTVRSGLANDGLSLAKLVRFDKELPTEDSMPPRDKYWVFQKYARGMRKGAHRQPKFTKITNRVPPKILA